MLLFARYERVALSLDAVLYMRGFGAVVAPAAASPRRDKVELPTGASARRWASLIFAESRLDYGGDFFRPPLSRENTAQRHCFLTSTPLPFEPPLLVNG